MPNAQGQQERVLLGIETSFKVPGASAVRLPITAPSAKADSNVFRSKALTGTSQPRPIVFGKHRVGGAFGLECSKYSLMVPLLLLMGTVEEFGTGTNVTHRYTFGPQVTGFAEQQFLDIVQYLLFSGFKLGKTEFAFAAEGLMEASFDLMGARQAPLTTVTSTSEGRDDTGAMPFDYMNASISIGGSAVAYLQECRIAIDRQNEIINAIDASVDPADVITKVPMLDLTFKALFQDATFFNHAVAGDEISIEIDEPDSEVPGHGMFLYLPTFKLGPTGPNTNGDGIVTLDPKGYGYARGSASNFSAQVGSKGFDTILIDGTNDTVVVTFSAGGAQTITLTHGSARTRAQIATDFAGLTNGSMLNSGKRLILKEAVSGSTGHVTTSGTGAVALGFAAGPIAGKNSVALVVDLVNDIATAHP